MFVSATSVVSTLIEMDYKKSRTPEGQRDPHLDDINLAREHLKLPPKEMNKVLFEFEFEHFTVQ